MAYEIPAQKLGVIPAEVSLITKQFTAVVVQAASAVVGTDGASVNTPSASGDSILGILQNNPIQGEACDIMVTGVSKAVIQGSVSIGQLLMSVPGGKLAVATSGNRAVAQALIAGTDSDVITVLLVRNGLVA